MKKSLMIWMGALLISVVGMSSCGDDESELNPQDVVYESTPTFFNGIWHMVIANYGFGCEETFQAGEVTINFNEADNTMKVENKKNINFLKSGNYPFETITEKRRIYTYKWVDVEYQVIVIQYSDEAFGKREVRYNYSFYDGKLCLDGGMSYDGPGYYFKKQEN